MVANAVHLIRAGAKQMIYRGSADQSRSGLSIHSENHEESTPCLFIAGILAIFATLLLVLLLMPALV